MTERLGEPSVVRAYVLLALALVGEVVGFTSIVLSYWVGAFVSVLVGVSAFLLMVRDWFVLDRRIKG